MLPRGGNPEADRLTSDGRGEKDIVETCLSWLHSVGVCLDW